MDKVELDKIKKVQFDKILKKYLPNLWIKLAFKYFSKETENKDMSVRNSIVYSLIGLFFIGFFSTVFNAPKKVIILITITYSLIVAILVLYLLSAVILNSFRIKKICGELNITRDEYNYLINKFYK